MLNDRSLRWSRRLSVVPRWVVVPTIQKQNVAEHTFHVVQTARWLLPHVLPGAQKVWPDWRLQVTERALDHDELEAATGDNPSPTKPRSSYFGLDKVDVIVKMADIMEALAFIREEQLMGNGRVEAVAADLRSRFSAIAEVVVERFPEAKDPYVILDEYHKTLEAAHPGLEKQ